MKDDQDQCASKINPLLERREFLQLAGALGLSVATLDVFSQPGSVFAAPLDVTTGLVGYWTCDAESGTIALDASSSGNNGTLNGGVGWTPGRINGALSFNGNGSEVDINKSVLDTSQDYAVVAWVHLDNGSNWASAVSQDGANVSGFFLQYTSPSIPNGGRFAFSVIDTDSSQGTTTRAISPTQPSTGAWYHIVGMHDATKQQIQLYVNGTLADTQPVGPAWNATGETVLGRARFGAGPVDFWPGMIDDVRLYNRLLSAQEITTIYQQAPAQTRSSFAPIRPPATPLVVRSPYVSTWLDADILPGNWPRFWTGATKQMTGIAYIDKNAYIFMGQPTDTGATRLMTQTNLAVTPTKSIFTLQGGGVTLSITFLSPVEAEDLQKQSVPLSYILVQAKSHDGRAHTVSLYFDISGEWAYGDDNVLIQWASEQIPQKREKGTITTFTVTPNTPRVLSEVNDYPSWGTVVWATENQNNLSTQSGQDSVVRAQFVEHGKLNNTMDNTMPRAINDRNPVFAFDFALGQVTTHPTQPITLVLGHVREPAVSYLGTPVPPLWKSFWSTWQEMLAATYDDVQGALKRADAVDTTITRDATRAGGTNYAALCALALRQAFAGTELVGSSSHPWLFLKEISSDGNVSTVDVVYPSAPVFAYTNPYLLRLLLDPLLAYAETGGWPKVFAEHDLGSHYPNADGHNDGNEEDMPIEETANMLIMAATYAQRAGKEAADFVNAHYTIFKQWADYLNAPNDSTPSRPNALDPLFQNQTDDFTGSIAHSTNLALKGIIAIGAMGILAATVRNTNDQQFYHKTAIDLISQWAQLGQDPSQPHLDIAYTEGDTAPDTGAGTSSLKYNAFPDKLLGLNLIPATVLQEEAAWYRQRENAYGIPLDTRHTYTKSDWEMWTAASTEVLSLRQYIIDALYTFANTSPSRVPFTDLYDTVTAQQVGFQARPVIGGLFSLLALLQHK